VDAMLKHRTIGPTSAGTYLVVYPTPGCSVPTTVCDCTTAEQAKDEAKRLNHLQRKQARAEEKARKALERRRPTLSYAG
jgi:hypothetical protein